MDVTKIVFVLLTLFHNAISRYMKKGYISQRLENESFCTDSSMCKETYFCDVKRHRCSPAANTKDVMNLQTCRSVFKKRCSTKRDCLCNETKMVCEENECVYKKVRKATSPIGGPCIFMNDCREGLCNNGVCTKVKSIEELIALTDSIKLRFRKCQITLDCKPGEECTKSGFCRRPFPQPFRKRKCKDNNCSQRFLS